MDEPDSRRSNAHKIIRNDQQLPLKQYESVIGEIQHLLLPIGFDSFCNRVRSPSAVGFDSLLVVRFVIGKTQFLKWLPEIATENPEARKKNGEE